MKAPGLYSAFTFSFFLHALVAVIAFFAARQFYTYHHVMPYTVSLVDSGETGGEEGNAPPAVAAEAAAPEPEKQPPAEQAPNPAVEPRMTLPEKKRIQTPSVKEEIDAIRAIHKLERMAALRKMITVGSGRNSAQARGGSGGARAGGGGGGANDYYSLVVGKITQQWIYPDTLDKNLDAVVSIRIAKDGSITIEKLEKSSGNSLFDRSVLRAITMASPLPPPLHEMEIGVNFNPMIKGR